MFYRGSGTVCFFDSHHPLSEEPENMGFFIFLLGKKNGKYELVSSYVLDYEINKNPHTNTTLGSSADV